MSLNAIQEAVFSRFANAVGLPFTIFGNIAAQEQTETHLRVTVLPGKTVPVGIASTDQETGFIQALIYIKPGVGELVASAVADSIMALFPRNLEFSGVRIDTKGFTSPHFYDNTWYVLPVSIPYQLIS